MLFEYGLEVSNNVVLLIFCYKNVMNINSGHLEKNPNFLLHTFLGKMHKIECNRRIRNYY